MSIMKAFNTEHFVKQATADSDAASDTWPVRVFMFRLGWPADNRHVPDIWSWSVADIDDSNRVSQHWHYLRNDVFHAVI